MEEVTFSRGPARRPLPRVVDPLLQWSTGLQTNDRRVYAGWLAVVGRSPAFDEAMERAGFSQVTIRHGSGNLVTHWEVEVAHLFVISDGIQTMAEMQQTNERVGLAFGWRTLPSGRQQSQLRFRAFLRELLEIGFYEPVSVTVKGTLTSDVITALMRQYDVLDAIDAVRESSGKPPLNPPFYACSIPLGPGEEVSRGSVQTREISPVVAQIPTPVTRDYIVQHWIKRAWVPMIEGLIDQTITWSVAVSAWIATDEEATNPASSEEEDDSGRGQQRVAATHSNGQGSGRQPIDDDLL